MVQCNRCNLQYIGETKRRLKDRFNEHRRAVDKTNIKSKPTTVSEHFLFQPNHSHTDMQQKLTFIVVYCRPFASKAVFRAILKEFEFAIYCSLL